MPVIGGFVGPPAVPSAGPAGTALTKVSGADFDVAWQYPLLRTWVRSQAYLPAVPSQAMSSNGMAAGTLALGPLLLTAAVTFDRIGIIGAATQPASATGRFAIYPAGTDGYPTGQAPALDLPFDVSTLAAGGLDFTVALTLGAGLWWVGYAQQGTGGISAKFYNGDSRNGIGGFLPTLDSGATGLHGLSMTGVTAALPTFTATPSATNGPIVHLRMQ